MPSAELKTAETGAPRTNPRRFRDREAPGVSSAHPDQVHQAAAEQRGVVGFSGSRAGGRQRLQAMWRTRPEGAQIEVTEFLTVIAMRASPISRQRTGPVFPER